MRLSIGMASGPLGEGLLGSPGAMQYQCVCSGTRTRLAQLGMLPNVCRSDMPGKQLYLQCCLVFASGIALWSCNQWCLFVCRLCSAGARGHRDSVCCKCPDLHACVGRVVGRPLAVAHRLSTCGAPNSLRIAADTWALLTAAAAGASVKATCWRPAGKLLLGTSSIVDFFAYEPVRARGCARLKQDLHLTRRLLH